MQLLALEAVDYTHCTKLAKQERQRQNALNISLVNLAMQEDKGDECRVLLMKRTQADDVLFSGSSSPKAPVLNA